MILILGDSRAIQVAWVTHFLKRWGANYMILDPWRFPADIGSWSNTIKAGPGGACNGRNGGAPLNFDARSVWVSNWPLNVSAHDSGCVTGERQFNGRACGDFRQHDSLTAAFWANPIDALRRASRRSQQLSLARALGFPVREDTQLNRTPWHARSSSRPGKHTGREVRVIIVQDRVFAVEVLIDSYDAFSRRERKHDFGSPRFVRWEIPEAVREQCLALLRELRLPLGQIDLYAHTDGEIYFVGLDPLGRFDWLDENLGRDVGEYLAWVLMSQPSPRTAGAR